MPLYFYLFYIFQDLFLTICAVIAILSGELEEFLFHMRLESVGKGSMFLEVEMSERSQVRPQGKGETQERKKKKET